MNGLAGAGPLTRLAVRRDRIMLPAWIYVTLAGVAANAFTLKRLYTTPAQRASLAAGAGHNPALVFLYGKLYGDSIGALTAWRYGVWAAIFAALMSTFIVVRHTRADEESGRLELIGSAAVGRPAPLAVALAVAGLGNVVLAVLIAVVLIAIGLPAGGSVALALGVAACGIAFAVIAALAAQLVAEARAARGIALGVLGAAYLLRAVGDASAASGPSWLSWLSPLGWTELIRAYAGQRWWVLALPAGLAVLAGWAAYALAARRDYGAGLVPDRPGRPEASAWLRGVFGLAWRLQRGTLAGWVASFLFMGAICGAAGKGIGSLLGSSAQLRQEFTRLGGQTAITNAYLAALVTLSGLAAAAYAVSAVLRLRSEETGGLAEPVLATAAGRIRWALSHVTTAVTGTAAVLAGAGLAIGLGYGLRAGDAGGEAARLLGAALAQLPASLAVAGVAVVLFGAFPRACVGGAWTAVAMAVLVALFGSVLRFPQWILDISPFTHVPKLPGGAVHPAPLLWLSVAAVALAAAGLAAFRRRDIG
jgi:ABC-2 type transport system permease protein